MVTEANKTDLKITQNLKIAVFNLMKIQHFSSIAPYVKETIRNKTVTSLDIKKQLLVVHSKANSELIANDIDSDPFKFQVLIELFLGEEYRIAQRAAMVVAKCVDSYPELIRPHLDRMILNLKNPIIAAVKRNTIRILQNIHIPSIKGIFRAGYEWPLKCLFSK